MFSSRTSWRLALNELTRRLEARGAVAGYYAQKGVRLDAKRLL